MGKYLTANVVLTNPETGLSAFLAEGADLPEWAVGVVGDHVLADDGEGGDAAEVAPPPVSGPGSGVAAWRTYAAAVDVDVDKDASRDDVIEALKAADKPV